MSATKEALQAELLGTVAQEAVSQERGLQIRERAPSATHRVGLIRVAGMLMALPLDVIREVIPAPPQYSMLPLQPPALRGAVKLRGDIIPVLDLARVLAPSLSDTCPPEKLGQARGDVVVVMRWQGRLLGLLADEVGGMMELPPGALFALCAQKTRQSQLASGSFQMGQDIGSLLDPERLADIPDIPLSTEQDVRLPTGQVSTGVSLLVFSFRGTHFAIETPSVNGAVSRTAIEQNVLTMGHCLGVINHHGYEVPVVDTLAMLQIAEPVIVAESAVVVARFPGGGLLGLMVDDVSDIVRVGISDIRPLPPIAGREIGFFRGVWPDATGRQHIVLDIAGLSENPQIMAMARLHKPNAVHPPSAHNMKNASAGEPYLLFKAGEERASAVSQISEILALPNDVAPFGGGAEMLGLLSHRGVALPLICLTTLLGGHSQLDRSKARILVVQLRGLAAGFVVEELHVIEPVRWDLGLAPTHHWSAESLLPDLLMFGSLEARRFVSHIDLLEKLREVAGLGHPPDLPRLCAA
jgi:purine-binding chemotaxis protein CheW